MLYSSFYKSNELFKFFSNYEKSKFDYRILFSKFHGLFIFQVSSLRNWGTKYIFHKMPRQIHKFSVCLGIRKKYAKNLAETFAYHVSSGFGIPLHFAKNYDLFFLQLILLILPILYCLLVTHLNMRNRRQYFFRWSPYFVFLVSLS